MFLMFYWIIDVRGLQRWTLPFVVIGLNAVAIYMSENHSMEQNRRHLYGTSERNTRLFRATVPRVRRSGSRLVLYPKNGG